MIGFWWRYKDETDEEVEGRHREVALGPKEARREKRRADMKLFIERMHRG